MSENADTPTIIVGVIPGKADTTVPSAARFAEKFGAELLCVFVDAASAIVSPVPDATFISAPLAPEVIEEIQESAAAQLSDEIEPLMSGRRVAWQTIGLVGDPARSLIDLAEQHNTMMFVVGTREGWRGSIHEFFNGSVAARLSHWQHRPVIVVPVAPKGVDAPLPWDQAGE